MGMPQFFNMKQWSFILFISGAAGNGMLGLIIDDGHTMEPLKKTSKTSSLGNTMKPLSNESLADIEKEVLQSEEENGPLTSDVYESLLLRKISGGNYSKWAKPRSENGKPLVVQTRLYFIRIQELDEARETFYSTVRFQLHWKDPAISWNPKDFGNISSLVVPGGFLWLPDLQLVNAINDMTQLLHDLGFSIRLFSDGSVWFHPTGRIGTRCKYDLTFYPFDKQHCYIIIESVIYTSDELSLILRPDKIPIPLGMFAENEVWDLIPECVDAIDTIYQSGSSTAFSRVIYNIAMKRRPGFFVMTTIIPTCLLGVITLLTYLVPIHYVDRTIMAVTVLLAVAVFQVMVAESLPKSSAQCVLTIYLTVILSSCVITTFVSTLCLAIVDPGEFIDYLWGIPNLTRALCGNGNRRASRTLSRKRRPLTISDRRRSVSVSQPPDSSGVSTLSGNSPDLNHHRQSHDDVFSKQRDRHLGGANTVEQLAKMSSSSKTEQKEPWQHKDLVPHHANEPDRHLTTNRRAWYIAYAINWIGFVICTCATTIVPLIFFVLTPLIMNDLEGLKVPNRTMLSLNSYYGD